MKKIYIYILIILLSFIFASFNYEVQAAGSNVDVDGIFAGNHFVKDTSGNQAIEQGTNLAAGIINNAIAINNILLIVLCVYQNN